MRCGDEVADIRRIGALVDAVCLLASAATPVRRARHLKRAQLARLHAVTPAVAAYPDDRLAVHGFQINTVSSEHSAASVYSSG